MADLSITPDDVYAVSTPSRWNTAIAYEDIEAGQCLWINGDDLAQLTDVSAAATALMSGIAVNSAADGQPVAYVISNPIEFGTGVFDVGRPYFASTGGGIKPHTDLAASELAIFIGFAATASRLTPSIKVSGVEYV